MSTPRRSSRLQNKGGDKSTNGSSSSTSSTKSSSLNGNSPITRNGSSSSRRKKTNSSSPSSSSLTQPDEPKTSKHHHQYATPRSRSPQGVIPSHSLYKRLVHKYELPRKLFHSSIGFFTLYLYSNGTRLLSVSRGLEIYLGVLVTTEVSRLYFPKFGNLYIKVMGCLMRESEVREVNGVVYYVLGLLAVFHFAPTDISVISLLLLSWADTTASTFGRAYGHLSIKFGSKSLIGSIAAFFTGITATLIFYGIFIPKYSQFRNDYYMWTSESSHLSLSVLSICIGFIGALAEAVNVFGLDDNLTIPILSALGISALVKIFHK